MLVIAQFLIIVIKFLLQMAKKNVGKVKKLSIFIESWFYLHQNGFVVTAFLKTRFFCELTHFNYFHCQIGNNR